MPDDATATATVQVARLRRAAIDALRAYPVEVASIRLLLHAYNTSFRVDATDGRRFALRLGTSRPKPDDQLTGELAWLDALANDTDLSVPAPVPTIDGGLSTEVWFEPMGRSLSAVLMTWLRGRHLSEPTPASCRVLGRAAGELHRHARGWAMPTGAGFPRMDEVMLDSPNRLIDDHPLLTTERRLVIDAALDRAQAAYDQVAAIDTFHPVHADLHGGNLKWFRGSMSVFDFDDAMTGSPVHDLAIAAYYLRDDQESEAALLEGYAEVSAVPDHPAERFEALLVARNLLLLNDVLYTDTAEMRDLAPRYLANTTAKLRAYLDTGVYRHDAPGVHRS